jgi:AcrR family transcriptional regulator
MSAPQGQASARRQASPRALSSPAPRLSHGVGNIQRARLVGAMVELAAQQGIAHVTVAHVVARSGMSRRTFYETFVDLEDCFLASCEDAYAHVARAVARVHDPRA